MNFAGISRYVVEVIGAVFVGIVLSFVVVFGGIR